MATRIFVNLPVEDVARTRRFFSALGYTFDPRFSNEVAICMVISPEIYAMHLQRDFFATFTPRPVADARAATEVLTALSFDSREAVDAIIDKAIIAGGSEPRPAQDHGFMYGRAFADPDGHIWEVFWMDPGHVAAQGSPT